MRRSPRVLLCTLLGLTLTFTPALTAQDEGDGFEFEVTTIDGEELSHRDFEDKVVIVDFWGTWCPPCKKAIPHLIKLYEKYEKQGLVILGLNYERTENKLRTVRAYADKVGIPYPLALGTEEIKAQVENFGGYPTMLFFKRGMRLDYQESGFQEDKVAAIEEWIVGALAEKKKPEPKLGPVKASLAARGGKALRIGDGVHATLVVLVHPQMAVDAKVLARLRALGKQHDGLDVATVSRADIDGAKADYLVDKGPMREVLRMGSAYPAYKLYDAKGRRQFQSSGRGDAVHKELLAAVEKLVGSAGEGRPSKGGAQPGAKKPGSKTGAEKEAAEKASAGKNSAEKNGPAKNGPAKKLPSR